MNLITSPWLPVLDEIGAVSWRAPVDLSGPGPRALAYPRPDFNAGVTEFLIGLMTVAFWPSRPSDWRRRWEMPPTADELAAQLEPLAPHFELFGDGPRAFQDLDPLADDDPRDIALLLIDAPGENALTRNTDHFVKRGVAAALSPAHAAAALITLQTYAPSGGAGHRTSLRGGGPLTTLVHPTQRPDLWAFIWANVELQTRPPPDDWADVFPWLAPCRTSGDMAAPTGPDDIHPAQAFFATPRRIRLGEIEAGACALGGPGNAVVTSYRTRNYGVNYVGVVHPLSPHRTDKASGLQLALHPRASAPGYRDWLSVWGRDTDAGQTAAGVTRGEGARHLGAATPIGWDIEAWGYALDNMKPLAWYQARVPVFQVADTLADAFYANARLLVAAAEEADRALQRAVRLALMGVWRLDQKTGQQRLTLPDGVKFDLTADLGADFWRQSEDAFCKCLNDLAQAPADADLKVRAHWLNQLRGHARQLFGLRLGDFDAAIDDPKRYAEAVRGLGLAFAPGASVAKALNLPKPEKPKLKPKKGGAV